MLQLPRSPVDRPTKFIGETSASDGWNCQLSASRTLCKAIVDSLLAPDAKTALAFLKWS